MSKINLPTFKFRNGTLKYQFWGYSDVKPIVQRPTLSDYTGVISNHRPVKWEVPISLANIIHLAMVIKMLFTEINIHVFTIRFAKLTNLGLFLDIKVKKEYLSLKHKIADFIIFCFIILPHLIITKFDLGCYIVISCYFNIDKRTFYQIIQIQWRKDNTN